MVFNVPQGTLSKIYIKNIKLVYELIEKKDSKIVDKKFLCDL